MGQKGRPRGLAGADSEETVRNVELSMCGWGEGRGRGAGRWLHPGIRSSSRERGVNFKRYHKRSENTEYDLYTIIMNSTEIRSYR